MPWPFQICDLEINDADWTAIIAPWQCNSVGITNRLSVEVTIKTDDAEDAIAAGSQELITAPYQCTFVGGRRYATRFAQGATVALLKSTSGSGTVKLRFLA